jgi:hypothetical protein
MIPIFIPIVSAIAAKAGSQSLTEDHEALLFSSSNFVYSTSLHDMHNVNGQVDCIGDGDCCVSGLGFELVWSGERVTFGSCHTLLYQALLVVSNQLAVLCMDHHYCT